MGQVLKDEATSVRPLTGVPESRYRHRTKFPLVIQEAIKDSNGRRMSVPIFVSSTVCSIQSSGPRSTVSSLDHGSPVSDAETFYCVSTPSTSLACYRTNRSCVRLQRHSSMPSKVDSKWYTVLAASFPGSREASLSSVNPRHVSCVKNQKDEL